MSEKSVTSEEWQERIKAARDARDELGVDQLAPGQKAKILTGTPPKQVIHNALYPQPDHKNTVNDPTKEMPRFADESDPPPPRVRGAEAQLNPTDPEPDYKGRHRKIRHTGRHRISQGQHRAPQDNRPGSILHRLRSTSNKG